MVLIKGTLNSQEHKSHGFFRSSTQRKRPGLQLVDMFFNDALTTLLATSSFTPNESQAA